MVDSIDTTEVPETDEAFVGMDLTTRYRWTKTLDAEGRRRRVLTVGSRTVGSITTGPDGWIITGPDGTTVTRTLAGLRDGAAALLRAGRI